MFRSTSESFFVFPTRRVQMLGAALALAIVLGAPAALAQFTIAAEVGVDAVTTDTSGENLDTLGVSAAARAGYQLKAGILRVTPELKLGFESPGTPQSFSVKGGARLNLFHVISPAIFIHGGGLVGDMEGAVWDIGVGLDLGLTEHIDLGIFAAYNQVGNAQLHFVSASYQSTNWEWMQFGGQMAIHF